MAKVYDLDGKVAKEIKEPPVFRFEYRPDLIKKAVLALQSHRRQPYGVSRLAGMDSSAENWGPGYGVARVPRIKTGRRAAIVPQAVGGRRAHPPKVEKKYYEKINRKEKRMALYSAISATANRDIVLKRGHVFDGDLPKIVVDEFQEMKKTKDVVEVLKALGIYGDVERAEKGRKIRAGKGKMRGRRYKGKKSLLIVVGEERGILKGARNLPGVDVTKVKDLNVELLAPGTHPGRLTLWTESAVSYLEGLK